MGTGRLIWWLRACNIFVLFLSAIYWFSEDPVNEMRITYWLLLALPWLIALFMPLGKLRLAAALVLGSSGVLGSIILLLSVLAPLGNHQSVTDWFLLVAMAASSTLALIAIVSPSARRRDDLVVAFVVVILAGLYEGSVLKAGPVFANYEPPIKTNPYQATYMLQSCLVRYKDMHGAYPDALNTLLNQSGCVNRMKVQGINVDYKAIGSPAAGFDLKVGRRSFWLGRQVVLSTNEGGMIRESHAIQGSRGVSEFRPIDNPSQLIFAISQCIQNFRQSHGRLPFIVSELWQENRYGCSGTTVTLNSNLSNIQGYWIGYDRAANYSSFALTGRPESYGITGVRSYYLDSQGNMHVTMQDRRATESDALAPECEYQRYATPACSQ